MAEVAVFADIALAEKFLDKLSSKTKTIADAGLKMQAIASAIVYKDIDRHFLKEEGPTGRWKAWSVAYREHRQSLADARPNKPMPDWKRKQIGESIGKILQDGGHLREAFMPANIRRVSHGLLWFNPARTSSGFPYAYAHNEGGPVLPARTFMWVSKQALDELSGAIAKWLDSSDD